MLDHAALPWFAELNRSLNDRLDDDAFVRRMRQSVDRLTALAAELLRARDPRPSGPGRRRRWPPCWPRAPRGGRGHADRDAAVCTRMKTETAVTKVYAN